MQYLVSKDNFTKITETKGTIQNISKTLTIEVSETQTKNSGVLLPPMGKIQFDGNSVYARCVDGAGAEARVIPFEVVAGGGDGGGVTADFSLDQAGTTIVENFRFSALEYPNATNPNLDGKTVLVMSVKDANATTSLVKYVFVDLAKLVSSSTNLKPSDNAIGISGASIGLNLSADAGNILNVADDGLYGWLGVAGGVSGNFAILGESGAIVDGGFSFADLAGLSTGKVFAGATSTAAGLSGLVPAPAAGDESKFLRGDGLWSTVGSGGASIAVFTGATSITGGLSGLVPAPQTGDQTKFLRGDGTWVTVSGGSVLDYRSSPSGISETISTNDNFIFGSAFKDTITVTGSYNEIRPGTQGKKAVWLQNGASGNRVIMAGVNDSEDNDVYIYGGSHNTVHSFAASKNSYYEMNGSDFNHVELAGANGNRLVVTGANYNHIEFTGTANDTVSLGLNSSFNCVKFAAGNNNCQVNGPNNSVICGTGNDSITFYSGEQNCICNFSDNDTINFRNKGLGEAHSLGGSTVNGSTVQLHIKKSANSSEPDSYVTLQSCTATQYHFQFSDKDKIVSTVHSGVYTVSGSQLVKAS